MFMDDQSIDNVKRVKLVVMVNDNNDVQPWDEYMILEEILSV